MKPERAPRSLTARVAAPIAALALVLTGATARGDDPVAVLITGPLAAKVGERVTFEVEIVNRSGRPLEKLRIVDYFDKGFHHEASASPIEQKGTIDLAAGTSRRLTLDFLLDEPGRQCHRVEILDPAHVFVGGATACVQVAPPAAAAPVVQPPPAAPAVAAPAPTAAIPAAPPVVAPAPVPVAAPPLAAPPAAAALEMALAGPAEAVSGSVSEYVATIRNTGSGPSGPSVLEFSWDNAFTPLEASDGYKLGTSRVSWELPAIEPGGQLRRQINLKSQAPANTFRDSPGSRSCVRGVLSGLAGGVMVADESCVLIRSNTPRPRTPREAGLRLSLADLDDPVRPGGLTTLVCTVSNNGSGAAAGELSGGRLDVVVVLPDQARLVGDPIPSRVRIDGSTVTFDSIPAIPPGGQSTFEVAYRLPAGGTGRASAILTGSDLDGSLETACTTTFLAP